MSQEKYRLGPDQMKQLVDHDGGCIATDRITVDGCPVNYLYREPPAWDNDTGWRMMAGDESDEYMDNADNHGVFPVNTIANYDNDIVPLVDAPIGYAFGRNTETGEFERLDSPVDPDECLHPDFPVVTGDYQLAPNWNITLPLKFNRREEDGSLILWRPGITIYFIAWNNDEEESIDSRLTQIKADTSRDAFEQTEQTSGGARQFSYRLVEDDTEALYGFAVIDAGHLQVAFYLDDEAEIEVARAIFASATS